VADSVSVEGVQGAHQPGEAGIESVVGRRRAGVVTGVGQRADDLRLHSEGGVALERPLR
jgi:hypothetical protein